MQRDGGFTIIEMLVVIAILSVLFALGFGAYRDWRDAENFRAAQRTIFETLNQARSDARRESQHQTLSWAGRTGNDRLQVCRAEDDCQTVTLPYGATFDVVDGPHTTFAYTAPFGRKTATEIEWLVRSRDEERFARVRVYGVTGKAMLTTCEAEDDTAC